MDFHTDRADKTNSILWTLSVHDISTSCTIGCFANLPSHIATCWYRPLKSTWDNLIILLVWWKYNTITYLFFNWCTTEASYHYQIALQSIGEQGLSKFSTTWTIRPMPNSTHTSDKTNPIVWDLMSIISSWHFYFQHNWLLWQFTRR